MNIKIISKTDDEIEVEVQGEDHTFMNVLKDALLRTEGVTAATYDMNPEQSGSMTDPVLFVKTDSIDPLEAIEAASDKIKEDASEFREGFEEGLSKA